MKMLKERVMRPLNNEKGAEVAEVGIWLALIVAGAVAIIATLGGNIVTAFTKISTAVTAAL